jgi:hypothetical protein
MLSASAPETFADMSWRKHDFARRLGATAQSWLSNRASRVLQLVKIRSAVTACCYDMSLKLCEGEVAGVLLAMFALDPTSRILLAGSASRLR